jgi:hypothetical protein
MLQVIMGQTSLRDSLRGRCLRPRHQRFCPVHPHPQALAPHGRPLKLAVADLPPNTQRGKRKPLDHVIQVSSREGIFKRITEHSYNLERLRGGRRRRGWACDCWEETLPVQAI